MFEIVLLIFFLILTYWSLRCRMRLRMGGKRRVAREGSESPVNAKSSLLSESIVELLGVSGGIYLALLMLSSFLKLSAPDQITIGQVTMDPIAALAFLIALIYPVITHFLRKAAGETSG
ncbi:MAG: hypothetical protein HYY09_03600 [Firmicutes bacterium]|nr:hypothetical protein [Bacillota bacterium]